MLRLLVDEHVSPAVARALHRRIPGLIAYPLGDWVGGQFLGQKDEAILQGAAQAKLTLVTYDLRTIPPLLKTWMESARSHGGVVLVDEKTIPPSQIGALARALEKLHRVSTGWDWKDQVCFLRR